MKIYLEKLWLKLSKSKGKIYQDTGSTGSPKQVEPKQATPRHIAIKMPKVKERILKAARETQNVNYKRTPIRLLVDFSTETL